jgi:YVTN family beta-propeller protein
MARKAGYVLPVVVMVLTLTAAAQRVVTSIPVSSTPFGIAVNPLNDKIYTALFDFSTGAGALAVINGQSNSQVATIPLPAASLVAVNLVTGRVYVAGCTFPQAHVNCIVSVVDGHTNELLTTIPISSEAAIGLQGLAVNPVTDRIYVSDADALKIVVIDGKTNQITASIPLGGQQPLGLAVDFVRDHLVAVINGPLIAVIDGRNNSIVQRIRVGEENANVALNPVIDRAYVTNGVSAVGLADIGPFPLVFNIAVGNNPFGVAVDLLSDKVFVTNLNDRTISMIDGRINRVVATFAVFGRFVDVDPVRGLAYASDDFSQRIHVISER